MGTGNEYANWVRTETESYRHRESDRLVTGIPAGECIRGLTNATDKDLLDAVPYGHIQVPPPTIPAVVAWYAVLILWRFKIWVDAPHPVESRPEAR